MRDLAHSTYRIKNTSDFYGTTGRIESPVRNAPSTLASSPRRANLERHVIEPACTRDGKKRSLECPFTSDSTLRRAPSATCFIALSRITRCTQGSVLKTTLSPPAGWRPLFMDDPDVRSWPRLAQTSARTSVCPENRTAERGRVLAVPVRCGFGLPHLQKAGACS